MRFCSSGPSSLTWQMYAEQAQTWLRQHVSLRLISTLGFYGKSHSWDFSHLSGYSFSKSYPSLCVRTSVCMCTRVHACTYMCGCAWVYCAHGDQVPRLGNHMFYIDINLSFHLPFNNCHPTRLGICCISYFQDSWSSSLFLITTHDAIESKAVIPLKMTPLSSSLLLLL